jgi:hypothetical protein
MFQQSSNQSTASLPACFAFDSHKTFYMMPGDLSKHEDDAILLLFEQEAKMYATHEYNEQEMSGAIHGFKNDDISSMGSLRYDNSDTEYDDDDDDDDDHHDHKEALHEDAMVDGPNPEPQPQQVVFLSENDVLFGRGGQCARSTGHQNYLQERNRLCIVHRTAPDNATKRQIQKQLIQFVHDKGGRFLESVKYRDAHDRIIQIWQVVPIGPRLYKKAAQALREGKPRA